MTCVHVVHISLHVNCAHNCMAQKLYSTKFVVVNINDIVVNNSQLHASCIVIGCK